MFGSQEVFREGEGCLRVREFEAEKERRAFRSQGGLMGRVIGFRKFRTGLHALKDRDLAF
jgi:hypothetical protein